VPYARNWLKSCRRDDRLRIVSPLGWRRGPEDVALASPEARSANHTRGRIPAMTQCLLSHDGVAKCKSVPCRGLVFAAASSRPSASGVSVLEVAVGERFRGRVRFVAVVEHPACATALEARGQSALGGCLHASRWRSVGLLRSRHSPPFSKERSGGSSLVSSGASTLRPFQKSHV
jgi:hypothetical protein